VFSHLIIRNSLNINKNTLDGECVLKVYNFQQASSLGHICIACLFLLYSFVCVNLIFKLIPLYKFWARVIEVNFG